MQYSIVFLSVVGLGLALPQGAPSPGQKLPFKKPGRFSIDCGFRGYDEQTCGTLQYCKAIDLVGSQSDELFEPVKYKSTKECLDAHDPAPAAPSATPKAKLAFSEDSSPDCGIRGYTEDLCGTEEYCKAIDKVGTGPFGHDERFKTTKECFDAHDPKPAPQQDPDRIVFPDSEPAQDPNRIVFPED